MSFTAIFPFWNFGSMFIDFPTPLNYNQGGIVQFQFVHISAVETWPDLIDGKISTPIVLKSGFQWLKGYSTSEKLNYLEDGKKTPNGSYYEKQINGVMPGDRKEIKNLMQEMQGRYFVVIFMEVGGLKRVAGGYGDLLEFSSKFSTGAARTDLKGYSFSFTGNGIYSSPIYL